MTVVGVYLIGVPYAVDKRYDYLFPPRLGRAYRGAIVTVPFGRGDRHRPAVVAFLEEGTGEGLKEVLSVEAERFAMTEEMMALSQFLRDHTLSSFGDAVRALLPAALLSGNAAARIATAASYRAADPAALSALLSAKGREGVRSPVHRKVLEALLSAPRLSSEEASALGASSAQLLAMCRHGWLVREESEVYRSPYVAMAERDTAPIALSRAQEKAYAQLLALYERRRPEAALLFGVTGSGKTRVMMKLMDRTIAEGRGVILMVPEIALTPQTVGIFCRRYGERVAVIHSSLSQGERFDAWRRIREGRVDLVIGTRSAVFAPLPEIGLILIDEEHEHTYKSDADPKYHTRDVAAHRAARHNALVVMASATPSLESYYKAERGIYTLVPLLERFGKCSLPTAEIVDLRAELRRGNTTPISARLAEHMADTLEAGEQAILFLNRRGYHSVLHCRGCGYVFSCPNCSVSLTHHEGRGGAYLMCHTCGHREPVVRRCPECGDERISFLGAGTQKAEGALAAAFPDMRVMRMDADTTATKAAYDTMLDAFRRGEADVLLGTQMVTKGHDFPRVTLSGVLSADISLHVPDFRAAERTFSLLTQVIGRAGRGEIAGHAVIQTFTPDNEIIALACRQDYEGFYRREIALRRELTFPPFCHIAEMTLTGEREEAVTAAADRLAQEAAALAEKTLGGQPLLIFGPFPARTFKAEGKFRMRLIFKCKLNSTTRAYFGALMREYAPRGGVTLSVDLDPGDV
ncbi:MAG: primosomal protein N' [Clostridia bacterium]|nr:primosomal protein N' [Clostridia bacterium]